jgi:hypothetical protein
MDMRRAAILNRIIGAEDAARHLRNEMRKRNTAVTPRDIMDLADCLAQSLQAIRELL